MTEAAMLSALFVVISLIAMSTGIAYSIYLDIIVPVFVAVIYLKCGFRYSVLSTIVSLIIIGFIIGNIGSAIWISQSILVGFACAILILKDTNIADDIFYSSIFACFIMVIIDIYFSGLLGFSFMKEFEQYINMIPIDEQFREIMFYIFVAALPVGTIITTYIGTLFIGKKLRVLNKHAEYKYSILTKGKNYWSFICCSQKTINIGIMFLIFIEILGRFNYKLDHTYIKAITVSIEYIVLYSVIKDSYGFFSRYVYTKIKSRVLNLILGIAVIVLLIKMFKITTFVLIISNIFINKTFHMREKQIKALNYHMNEIL